MRAYERLLKYVKVWTTSDPESGTHPSTMRQFDLAHQLVQELKDLGLTDAHVDEHCYVYATPARHSGTGERQAPWASSPIWTPPMTPAAKTSTRRSTPTTTAARLYCLPPALCWTPAQFPFLTEMKGETLITTDGSTLLGADDKAGVSEIMTMLERVIAEKRPHGKLCIGFTPDEEIGEGASLFDVEGFGAAYAYTVDGEDAGEISYENFNAAAAVVTVHGFSVHPGSAKNTMINAQNVAMEFHAALPAFSRPEHTEGREGFFHLTSMVGDVTTAKLGYIVRDHDAAKFAARKAQMEHIAACLNERYGEGTVDLDIHDSYRNMLEKIQPHFHLVENARKAIRAAGLEPIETPVRGGTDGATLSYMGLPCPNLGTGGFNFHGPCECITAEKMDQCTEILLNLVDLYK